MDFLPKSCPVCAAADDHTMILVGIYDPGLCDGNGLCTLIGQIDDLV